EHLESKYLRGQSSLLSVSSAGLWLRQTDGDGQSIVHALRIVPDTTELKNVIIFRFDHNDRFSGRIDAASARLADGYWNLEEAWITAPNKPAHFLDTYRVKTDLTLGKIQDSFAPPETMSFWDLPGFIEVLEQAGFSAIRHRIHW
ncbi:MAG: LptF/LptG family permease, partial [Desulfuromonadales bacterium]|nr:LptF/LptG family permease [Desulfuromonadales bacterium]